VWLPEAVEAMEGKVDGFFADVVASILSPVSRGPRKWI
jgi:hypothetical protein